jgi:hypothetical protein
MFAFHRSDSNATRGRGRLRVLGPNSQSGNVVAFLGDKMSVDYGVAYENLLNAANAKLNRSLCSRIRCRSRLKVPVGLTDKET